MRVHLILDLEKDESTTRQTFSQVTEQLEAELEHNDLEVDGVVYSVKVMGVGKNPREVDESYKLRAQYRD